MNLASVAGGFKRFGLDNYDEKAKNDDLPITSISIDKTSTNNKEALFIYIFIYLIYL